MTNARLTQFQMPWKKDSQVKRAASDGNGATQRMMLNMSQKMLSEKGTTSRLT